MTMVLASMCREANFAMMTLVPLRVSNPRLAARDRYGPGRHGVDGDLHLVRPEVRRHDDWPTVKPPVREAWRTRR